MFSTSEAAIKFSDEFKSLDGVASANRKTIIIGEPEDTL